MSEHAGSRDLIVPALVMASALHAVMMFGVRIESRQPLALPRTVEVTLLPAASETVKSGQIGLRQPVSGQDEPAARPDASIAEQQDQERIGIPAPREPAASVERGADVQPPQGDAARKPVGMMVEAAAERGVRSTPRTSRVPVATDPASGSLTAEPGEKVPRPTPAEAAASPARSGLGDEAITPVSGPIHLNTAALGQQISEWSQQYAERMERESEPSPRTARVEQVVSNRVSAAAYERAWQDKVERVGNMNYPEEARRKNLTGGLVLSVAVKADGTIQTIHVRKSSGHAELDQAAARIVRLAAPFSAFPSDLRKDYDVLWITRTWRFLIDNRLATTP